MKAKPTSLLKPAEIFELIWELIHKHDKHTSQILAHPTGLSAIELQLSMIAPLRDWFGSEAARDPRGLTHKWNIAFSVFTRITLCILRNRHIGFSLPPKYTKRNHSAVLNQWCGVCARVARGGFRKDYRLKRKPRKHARR